MATACVDGEFFEITGDGELTMIPGSMGFRQRLSFGTPGTHQFNAADYPWLARLRVEVQGGGGGSAGANAAADQCIARPGGAGGGYSSSVVQASALGAVETIVVGQGGAAGAGNASGGPGGQSAFGGFVSAPGGDGGTSGMTSGVALVTSQGVAGPFAGSGQFVSGGGASGGALRLSATQGLSGAGGESYLGHGGYPRSTEGPGTAPRGWGGGAGGAFSLGESVEGFAGGDGIVILYLYA